jgi:hypothetical protein
MDGSLSTAEAVFRFARQAAASGRGSLRSLVLSLCAAAGDCTRYALRRDTARLQWSLLEVLWCACQLAQGDISVASAIPCGSLDAVVLRLFRVVSQVAEMYRWFDGTGNEPLEWDGLPEVVALAVLALELTGADLPAVLTGLVDCAVPD